MANAAKKQDEHNLSVLREQLSLPANKYCFDCHQRGPTYVNVTIGSFVCTSCSGLLRGLTPPHRVKSVSMATFSTEEIDFIKSRGNENCQRVWLGTYDSKQPTKDEKQIKDFMISKYEKKTYYSDPVAQKPRNGFQPKPSVTQNITTTTNQNSINMISPAISISTPNKFDFFKEEPVVQTSPSFANFDNNPVFSNSFDSTKSIGVAVDNSSPCPSWKSNGSQAPSEDRYAALKDLDYLMKSQSQQDAPPLPQLNNSNNSAWSSDTSLNGTWSSQLSENNSSQNPFKDNNMIQDSWISSNDLINPFLNSKSDDWQTNVQWTNGMSSSQSMGFNDAKPWNPDFSNPFKVSSEINKHSSNPFL
ncbi:uncharacterized protein LOC126836739 isoform X3 [Adelges cooleyi]|uniref:uncharacterized protein LOC126836739 isoform X3 n=1 Tax=Adelges cooleyi TaxID=133065 RepID=UPI00217FF99F|nr:uncharacterized protein LOC126836739 isoform X3 [Adelges cooleyi]